MNVLDADFIKGFMRMCADGWDRDWHERNGGNLTYRVQGGEIASVLSALDMQAPWQPIGTSVPGLAGEFFVTTGAGKFFRNVPLFPEDCIGIAEIDERGERFRIVWGLKGGGRPTSEFPSHLMNHEVKKEATGGRARVLYHCHPVNLIALTFILPLTAEAFTRELWEMMTECPIIFPNGIGVVEWMVPGGREIAVASSALMREYDAIVWAHHGLFCAGETFDDTFGLAHAIEKSSEMLIKVLSVVPEKRQTIREDQFPGLEKPFGMKLNKKFLFKK
jgi:rhamnulose-1-phosphate aldolase